MRLGLLSDVHANLEALQAVLISGHQRGVEQWVCLGDVVGYGADPLACIQLVRERCRIVLMGNHDAAVSGLMDARSFNAVARTAVQWTAEQLSAAERYYLASLPLEHTDGIVHCVHAEPHRPAAWGYVADVHTAGEALDHTSALLCFVGHSHRAFVCARHGDRTDLCTARSGTVELDGAARYLANVGSVGQPRDGQWRSCYGIWDQEQRALELVRCPYDIESTQQKIRAAGLPNFLADRLAQGH